MIVVDASAMVELLLGTELGQRVDAEVLGDDSRHAPHLLDVEVAQVLRRLTRKGELSASRARQALEDLALFPIRRHGHTELPGRMFALHANCSACDAACLALAEATGAELVTCDAALGRGTRRQPRAKVIR